MDKILKITPQDIVTQKFAIKVKGYDKDEVNLFLLQISEILENEIIERENLKKELDQLKDKTAQLQKREDILRETLISAQKFSHEIKHNAERDAELLIKESEMKADMIVNNAVNRSRELKDEIRNLKHKRVEIENDLISMLSSLKNLIESYRKDDDDFEKVEYLAR